jgi:hypothetical protein
MHGAPKSVPQIVNGLGVVTEKNKRIVSLPLIVNPSMRNPRSSPIRKI